MNHEGDSVMAIDGDGVLLDFHAAYAVAWEQAFGEKPALRSPLSYWPADRYAVRHLSDPVELDHFRSHFDDAFWSSVPALPVALEACHALTAAGHRLVCVTALGNEFRAARARNLIDLGFPIEEVHCTGHAWHANDRVSPKAEVLQTLRPVAFVDDFAPFLRGVPSSVHKALIQGGPDNSPNVGDDLALAHSTHADLLDFAKWWIARPQS